MRKTVIRPKFRMAFSKLEQLGDKAVLLITRDLVPLTTFGITAATQAAIEAATLELKNFPTDEELKADVGHAVELRNQSAEASKVMIREIIARVINKFGDQSSEYRSFGTKGMDDMTLEDLNRCGRRVVRQSTHFLVELGPLGLTQQIIDDLDDMVTDLDDKIDKKVDADMKRNGATSKRVGLGNTLYDIITRVFETGKVYWVSRNEAMFNDYVIYNTPDLEEPEPGQYGAAHGTLSSNPGGVVPENALIFFDGVEVPIEVDNDGEWAFDQIPVICKKVRATADNCTDYEADCEILPDEDVQIDIDMDVAESSPV